MSAEQVPAEWVELAARAMADDWNPDRDPILTAMFRDYAASALAAVLPLAQAQALEDYAWALETARSAWENVTTLDAIPADLRARAARLRAEGGEGAW